MEGKKVIVETSIETINYTGKYGPKGGAGEVRIHHKQEQYFELEMDYSHNQIQDLEK